jgi:hypothetical protein
MWGPRRRPTLSSKAIVSIFARQDRLDSVNQLPQEECQSLTLNNAEDSQ